MQAAPRTEHLGQPAAVTAAYAAAIGSAVAVLTVLGEQIKALHGHPAAEIVLSQSGPGPVLGARVLAEFGDAEGRYVNAKARKNYAGTSPITRASSNVSETEFPDAAW